MVYHIDGQGMVTVLWPRTRYDDGFVFAGHEYLLPVTGARRLTASSEAGEGFIEAIVSKYPFDLRDLELDFHHELDLVEVSRLTPATAIRLSSCIERGEFVAIMADRIPLASKGRTQSVEFLGQAALLWLPGL